MDCPQSMVGRVIGKSGETIKALQKHFGCNIQIDQNVQVGCCRLCCGTPAADMCVLHAQPVHECWS